KEMSILKGMEIGTGSTVLVGFPVLVKLFGYAEVTIVETPIQLSRARPHIEHTIGESVSKLLVTSTYLAYLSGTDKAVSLSLRERYPGYDGLGEEWTTDMDKMINWPQVDNSSKNELA